ncbi:ABC transporter substrate-binding protein [Roseococcus sp.]|uniref:ABC transporter substrate-binding protein n=1 Tax=Roseococcus sp. TaxID=2109646 RepID=UPI003BAD9088
MPAPSALAALSCTRRPRHRSAAALLIGALAIAATAGSAGAAETIRFGLNWLPEAEHCGFYEAQEKGLYQAAGLDVTLEPGGPDKNVPLSVAAGKLDLGMGSSFTTFNLQKEGVAAETIGAFFQKDPQTLVAHAGQGIATLADLKGKPIMIAKFSQFEFWQFLKTKYGFSDQDIRPYTYSSAPFLADPKAVQQGYITEDALLLGKEMPEPPVSILLADYGYQNYASTIFGTTAWIEAHKDAVKAFVKATAEGYRLCVTGDYAAAMKAVMAANPDHTAALFDFKIKQMVDRGLVAGGDAEKGGIGAMTDARWKDFFDTMVTSGVYPKDTDYKAAYSLEYLP